LDDEAKQREDAHYITQYNAKKGSTLDAVNSFQPPLPLDVLHPLLAPIPSISDVAPQREERPVARALSNPRESSSAQREPLAPSSSPLPTVAPLPTPIPTVDPSPTPSLTPGPRRSGRTIRVPRRLSEAAVQEPIALAASRSDPDTLSFDEAMRNNSTEWMEAVVQEMVDYVEDVMNTDWFRDVLEGNQGAFDATLVLAHMDASDRLVNVILDKIRSICGDTMLVQFITGHTHGRKYVVLDDFSTSFEAGHFLDTVGLASFSFNETNAVFEHKFIDANVSTMKALLGMPSSKILHTPNGRDLSSLIKTTQESLGLNRVLGCSPATYDLSAGMDEPDSLWGLFAKKVVPNQFFNGSDSKLLVQNRSYRYNLFLFQGQVTINDLISMSPHNDSLFLVAGGINGTDFLTAFGEPNLVNGTALPEYVISGQVVPDQEYDVYTVDVDVASVKKMLEDVTGWELEPVELDGQTIGTLWAGFVGEQWQCTEPEKEDKAKT